MTALPPDLLALAAATRRHQRAHSCNAHAFADGAGLYELVMREQPGQILELGTGLGYTACLMALAQPRAVVDTVEGDPVHAALARARIDRLGLATRVRLHAGSFAPVLDALALAPGTLDLVFFDGNMPPLLLVQRLHGWLREGGVLVCANLELNGPSGARRVKAELADAARWQPLPPLERGQTAVVRKRAGHATPHP